MYYFVLEDPAEAGTASAEDRRRAELLDSDARSHAAKIAYLKKIAKERPRRDDGDVSADTLYGAVARRNSRQAEAAHHRRDSSEEFKDEDLNGLPHPPGKPLKAPKIKAPNGKSSRRQARPAPGSKGNRIYSRAKFKLEPLCAVLPQTTQDPFDAFPHRRLPEIVEKVVHDAFDRIWPETLCAVRGESLAVAKSEWKGHGLQDDLLFHVQVALACGLNLALQNVPKVSEALALARLSHYSKAIRLMKERIEGLEGSASEDLMMSMLVLGVNADVEEAMPEAHPPSPLATSQYMHLYGRLTLMPSYATALHQLVEARGGIFKLKHLALADWLLLADLHHASRTGDRLRYPPLRAYNPIVATGRHIPDAEAISLAAKLASGIQELESFGLSGDLSKAMRSGVEAVVALDHYHRYENEPPRLVDVMLAANEAQRDFLEVTSQDGFGLAQLVNNCCRWAALIFSDIVLFPMPSCTRIQPRLAREVRLLLEAFEETKGGAKTLAAANGSPCLSDMLLWVLVLGGIAASFTEHRPWFRDRLRANLYERCMRDEDFDAGSWKFFHSRISRFLWWGPVIDGPAKELWEDVTGQGHRIDGERIQGRLTNR